MKSKKSRKKKLIISITLVILIGLLFYLVTLNKSIDREIIGSWSSVGGEECDNNMNETITFKKDNTVEGIDGFKEYRIETTEHDEYDYAILTGVYEDATRYRIKIENETLSIVYEDGDTYDFESAIACHMIKK